MSQELNTWQFIAKRLRKSQAVMLLLVVESQGSSPGRQGFKMAVDAHGELCGSIGGGVMEVKLVELAKVRLQEMQPEALLKKQIHRKSAPQFQSGMICSGEQTIVFFPLQKVHFKVVQNIIRCLKSHRPALLHISYTAENQLFKLIEDQQNDPPFRFERPDEQHYIFEENLGFKNRLFIVGGGHCALALSELMSKMDFYICLLDDRPDLSTITKNKFVHEKHLLENYAQIGDFIPSGPHVYVVVMTLGYRFDELVLRQLWNKSFRYFGMLGSATKIATLWETLHAEGFSKEQLDRIHAPIGLKINSRTPEEIAVSIAAEIVAVKNGYFNKI